MHGSLPADLEQRGVSSYLKLVQFSSKSVKNKNNIQLRDRSLPQTTNHGFKFAIRSRTPLSSIKNRIGLMHGDMGNQVMD